MPSMRVVAAARGASKLLLLLLQFRMQIQSPGALVLGLACVPRSLPVGTHPVVLVLSGRID